MREKLVCYLLGELDEAERLALEARLAAEPCLRKELEQIRACLNSGPGDDDTSDDCPTDLADRTAVCVSKAAVYIRDGVDPACRESRFTFVDMCVAAGVLLAVFAMLLPALPQSRELSRRDMCADNMRQIGQALLHYADNHGDEFPFIRPDENAGMFAVRLVESGELPQQELQRLLWCRASGLQEELQQNNTRLMVVAPTYEQLQLAKGQALAMLRRWMAGSYAYRLGYVENSRYLPITDVGSSVSPLLSDSPTLTELGWISQNHGPNGGQNVLHQDGGVRYQVTAGCPAMDTNLFLNRSGRPAAGEGPTDVVLARSDMTPDLPPSVKVYLPRWQPEPSR